MAVILKNSKRRMYSTWIDVVARLNQLATEDIDMSEQASHKVVMNKGIVENFIVQADAMLLGGLRRIYSTDTNLRATTAWGTTPFSASVTDTAGKLLGIGINDNSTIDAYTAAYIVEFSSATTYSVTSSLEGVQIASATIGASTTTSNGVVSIDTNSWSGTFDTTYKFMFSVVDAHPLVWTVSNYLATGAAIQSLYGESIPNVSEYGDVLTRLGNRMLDELSSPSKRALRLESYSAPSLASQPIDYFISELGYEQSSYLLPDPQRTRTFI